MAMFPEVATVNQLSVVISQTAAPAFLLGAIASFLSVLVSHMSRISDRTRELAINETREGRRAEVQEMAARLKKRAALINRAIYLAVASGIATSLLMMLGFITAYFGFRHEPGAAIMFSLSLLLFTASLISFAREVHVGFMDSRESLML
jgi:Protein of unknown function (DUF2721)